MKGGTVLLVGAAAVGAWVLLRARAGQSLVPGSVGGGGGVSVRPTSATLASKGATGNPLQAASAGIAGTLTAASNVVGAGTNLVNALAKAFGGGQSAAEWAPSTWHTPTDTSIFASGLGPIEADPSGGFVPPVPTELPSFGTTDQEIFSAAVDASISPASSPEATEELATTILDWGWQ